MRRELEDQRDFAEAFLPDDVGRDHVLERVGGLIDWWALEAVCGDIDAAPVGRPNDPLRALIKSMLVRAWWALSNSKAEQLLRKDLRFCRFLGVGLTRKTRDRNTLRHFDAWASPAAWDRRAKQGLAERQLGKVDRRREKGLVVRRGSLVDATLIRSAASSRNRRKDGTAVDADADRTTRDGRDPTLGDKLHAAVDEDTGIVRRIALTPASCHDRRIAEAAVPEDAGSLWVDAAYDARALREGREARGITPVIAHNPCCRGLVRWQKDVDFRGAHDATKDRTGVRNAETFLRPWPRPRLLPRPQWVDVTFRIQAFDLRRAVTVSPPAG